MPYICLDCGKMFDQPVKLFGEKLEFWGEPCREQHIGCPYCGGEYQEAYQCDYCGKYIIGNFVVADNGQCLCENCYDEYGAGTNK